MKRFASLALIAAMVFGCVAFASAATEVKMTGDARIHANFWNNINYTGWNAKGTNTGDSLTIWERFRLRSDFIANEGLKFRFGIRVNNKAWGNDTFTVDNPATSIDVYQAFLQFKWPSTDVEFTVGLQDMDLPISAPGILNSSPVFGGTRAAAAVVSIPVIDQLKIVGGFTRLLDSNKDFDTTTKQVADELDGYFLVMPITLDGFSATPWGMLAVAGKDATYTTPVGSSPRYTDQSLATNLASAGYMTGANTGFTQSQTVYWWVGSSFAVTALDPFKFYADVIYGEGASDQGSRRRAGLFFDVAAEYTGFDMLTPQATFWYSTGEDKSTGNGSERMPTVVGSWGPSTSFLFDSSQAFAAGHMGLNPIGTWGFAVSLNKISFMQDLTHRLTFTYAQGTNNARALRNANTIWGTGNYVQMGRDLTTNEYVMGVNFDNQYNIYENLAAIVETGWAHGSFQSSVWGHRLVNQAQNGDAWKVAFGLQYKF
ncbi:outer membrane homotrimeric porin [Fundidesulfovibrio terrae]|uniref:outer membrane homotrimeric porin n=1 Tax=Fundidesulfovibrio terrae TaxID=2922866 RepID=UPI001FAFFF65|nr:outer membrane homotrimeric porin [Fundidesulfovibrio terrae]